MMKRLSALLILTIFLLNFGLIAEAKQNTVIDKIVFIHRENTPQVLAEMAAKPASSDKALYKWSGLHWETPPINYFVNINDPRLYKNAAINAIKQSFETWDDASSEEIFTTATSSNDIAGDMDNKNEISFGSLSSGTIAVTYIWYIRGTKEVVEVDTIFNTYYQWSTTAEADKMDLQNIATHEFGHWLVLNDLYTRTTKEQTMYGYSDYGETIKRTLESGDVAGIQKIYGP